MPKAQCSSREEIFAQISNEICLEVNKKADYHLEDWIQSRIYISNRHSVMDIGCGNGKQVTVFSNLVGDDRKVPGVDIFSQVPDLLEKAK